MALDEKLSAQEITREVGMSNRPEYYSGRGATVSDLNSKMLDEICGLVQKNHGRKASRNFVKMIEKMPVLSATDFLLSFYALEENGWEYEENRVRSDAPSGIIVRKDSDGNYDPKHGMVSIMSALSRGQDQTNSIKMPFLNKHGSRGKRMGYDSIEGHFYFE